MDRIKVLLAGESWISAATHYKGFDSFVLPPTTRAPSRWSTLWLIPSST